MELIKLDLHSTKHEDVRNKVIRFIEEHWNEEAELEIITGHSERMKGLVINILQEYKLPYHIGYLYGVDAPRVITWT